MSVQGHILENPFWYALQGPQASFGLLATHAARFQPAVSPIAGLEQDTPGAWAELAALTGPGEVVAVFSVARTDVPGGWTPVFGGEVRQMTQPQAPTTLPAPDGLSLRVLTAADVPAMMELVRLTRPGPFEVRTVELGLYLGLWDDACTDGAQLVAMAGQRVQPPGACEISAVCTRPGYQRRGLARVLVSHVAAHTHAAGRLPFLHVDPGNTAAIQAYAGLGFVPRQGLRVSALRRDG